MKRILITAIVVIMAVSAKAQQDPQYTQWFSDKQSFNPAAVGLQPGFCATGIFRNQWSGFENQPQTFLLNMTGNIDTDGLKGGYGLTFYSDKLGQENNTIVRGSFGYHLNAGSGTLSLGLGLGYYGKQLGNDWLPPEGVASIADDSAINSDVRSDNGFDLNFGVYYFKPKEYYFGISATHLTQSDLDQLSIQLQRHFYVMGGYNFNQIADGIDLRTNLLAKSDFNKWALDINANILWNDMLYGGISYRPGDAIAPHVGIEYCSTTSSKYSTRQQCFRLGYSYDVTTSEINNFSSGSHEIMMGYCLYLQEIIVKQRHANPRFL
jgi:type IX secretion system PorP/SprF family membrane protein